MIFRSPELILSRFIWSPPPGSSKICLIKLLCVFRFLERRYLCLFSCSSSYSIKTCTKCMLYDWPLWSNWQTFLQHLLKLMAQMQYHSYQLSILFHYQIFSILVFHDTGWRFFLFLLWNSEFSSASLIRTSQPRILAQKPGAQISMLCDWPRT